MYQSQDNHSKNELKELRTGVLRQGNHQLWSMLLASSREMADQELRMTGNSNVEPRGAGRG